MNNDLDYLNRRVSEERKAAFRSQDREVAQIHRELAESYEFRIYLLKQMDALKVGKPAGSAKADEPTLRSDFTKTPAPAPPHIMAL